MIADVHARGESDQGGPPGRPSDLASCFDAGTGGARTPKMPSATALTVVHQRFSWSKLPRRRVPRWRALVETSPSVALQDEVTGSRLRPNSQAAAYPVRVEPLMPTCPCPNARTTSSVATVGPMQGKRRTCYADGRARLWLRTVSSHPDRRPARRCANGGTGPDPVTQATDESAQLLAGHLVTGCGCTPPKLACREAAASLARRRTPASAHQTENQKGAR